MKFQLLIKVYCWKIKTFLAFKLSDLVINMLLNVKIPTIVGILAFMSMIIFMIIFMLSWAEHEKKFYNLAARIRMNESFIAIQQNPYMSYVSEKKDLKTPDYLLMATSTIVLVMLLQSFIEY